MQLHELQRQFLDGLLQQHNDASILRAITPINGRSAQELLGIYHDSVVGGLNKALAAMYPVCCKLVGESFFNAMATRFITQQVSTSPDLNDYGREFADFIEGFTPAAALPYLPDVSRLEWAWHRVFTAVADPELNLQQLADVTESQRQQIVFRLAPTARVLHSAYPVHHIWQVNQDDYEGDEHVNLDEGGVKLLIWRQGLIMHIDPLTDAQWLFLDQLQSNTTLGQLCEKLSKEFPAIDSGELLSTAIHRGWLTSFHT